MKKKKLLTKSLLIFVIAIILAWFSKSLFAQLYISIIQPDSFTGFIMYQTKNYLEGFLISYIFIISFSIFIFLLLKFFVFVKLCSYIIIAF